MEVLSNKELITLGRYQFLSDETKGSGKNRKENHQLLCIRRGSNGERELSTVSTLDATCWEQFKKIFNCGKLAGTDLSLRAVSRYLIEKDLQLINPEHLAYQTIHGIAARCLFYKKDPEADGIASLWKRISTPDAIDLQEVRKTYSPRPGRDPSYTTLKSTRIPIHTTAASTLNHLRMQGKIWLEKQGRSLWTETSIDAIRPEKWVHRSYHYNGLGRGYTYEGPYPYSPILPSNKKISDFKLTDVTLRAITDISVPRYLLGENGFRRFV